MVKIFLLALLIIDLLLFIVIFHRLKTTINRLLFALHSILVLSSLYFVGQLAFKGHYSNMSVLFTFLSATFLIYLPKVLYVSISFFKILAFKNSIIKKFIDRTAILLSSSLFIIVLYGITLGRYNYKIEEVDVEISNLPESFKDFTIVQITDMHLGSVGKDYPGIKKMVEEVNKLKPDIIAFTGDMVNSKAEEIVPWISTLSELKAKYGIYAVTGNHDHGDHARFENEQDKENNRLRFEENISKAGFTLLNDSSVVIKIGTDSIFIAGVRNMGRPRYRNYGDLNVATNGIDKSQTILLSHNPAFWENTVKDTNIALTLSGHTHASQMGIKLGSWSYIPNIENIPQNGLYQYQDSKLYVSRGVGFVGFSGRIGMRPEITLIRLH